MEVEADRTIPPVDSESWSEVLHCGSLVDCQVDSRMVKAELVNLTLNIQFGGDRNAWRADELLAHHSWVAVRFDFLLGGCFRRSNLSKFDFYWRREVAINEQECPPIEKDLVGCVGVENGGQTMTGHRLDVGCWARSIFCQYSAPQKATSRQNLRLE